MVGGVEAGGIMALITSPSTAVAVWGPPAPGPDMVISVMLSASTVTTLNGPMTDEARYIGYATAFEIPMPALQQPGKRVHDLLMLGSLPRRVRELYDLDFTAARRLAFEATVRAVRTARRLTPTPLARGWNTRSFDGVARTERRRIEKGIPTP